MILISQYGDEFNSQDVKKIFVDGLKICAQISGDVVTLASYDNFEELDYIVSCLKACDQLLRPTFKFPPYGCLQKWS